MTHPTHGLEPNALEAARSRLRLHHDLETTAKALFDRARRLDQVAGFGYEMADFLTDLVPFLYALSQNPGTSNTSGEAEPVAWRWRFPPGGWHYASEKPEFAPYDAERVHGPFPMYATLEPRASDREAVIDEIEAIIDAKVAEIDGQIPNSPRMRGRIGYAIERLSELRDAIRKLSEVSHV